jgi:hypothetical protein
MTLACTARLLGSREVFAVSRMGDASAAKCLSCRGGASGVRPGATGATASTPTASPRSRVSECPLSMRVRPARHAGTTAGFELNVRPSLPGLTKGESP